jgi:hypothetical protein
MEGSDDTSTEKTLAEGDDYRLIYAEPNTPTDTFPIVGIKLYDTGLTRQEYLKLTGVYGYSPDVPDELGLELELYTLLKKVVLWEEHLTDSGGRGMVRSSKIDKISISYGSVSDSGGVSSAEAQKTLEDMLKDIANNYNCSKYAGTVIRG